MLCLFKEFSSTERLLAVHELELCFPPCEFSTLDICTLPIYTFVRPRLAFPILHHPSGATLYVNIDFETMLYRCPREGIMEMTLHLALFICLTI